MDSSALQMQRTTTVFSDELMSTAAAAAAGKATVAINASAQPACLPIRDN